MYHVHEIFVSVQGEGVHAGMLYTFVRFAGCNLSCSRTGPEGFDCDTEFTSGRSLSLEELIAAIREEEDAVGARPEWVCLTGGEPALQVDAALISALHGQNRSIAIETNGTIPLLDDQDEELDIDWITVSPKTAEHTLRQLKAHEVKYVRAHGQGLPKTHVLAQFYLISPAFQAHLLDMRNVQWCLGLVKENPTWRLSLQLHKLIGAR